MCSASVQDSRCLVIVYGLFFFFFGVCVCVCAGGGARSRRGGGWMGVGWVGGWVRAQTGSALGPQSRADGSARPSAAASSGGREGEGGAQPDAVARSRGRAAHALPDFLRAVREARDVCRAAAPAALRVHLLGTRLGASACPRAALGAFLRAAAAAAPLGRHGRARRATERGAGGSEGSPGASSSVLAGVLWSAPVGARPHGRPPPYGAPRSGAR